MSAPVPSPRSGDVKKPVPTPRRLISNNNVNSNATSGSKNAETDSNQNTFSRRVKSASRQIAEDIGEIVHDRKKAVIEGTRQSVRKLTRHLSFSSQGKIDDEDSINSSRKTVGDLNGDREAICMFNNIKFNSPLTVESIYNNIDVEETESASSGSLPPPRHPPPPLRDDILYDAPSSIASNQSDSNSDYKSSNSDKDSGQKPRNINSHKPDDYESVFPAYANNSDSDSCIDMTERKLANHLSLSSSCSWKFYDTVNNAENVYNELEPTAKPLIPSKILDKTNEETDTESLAPSSILRENSLYENHEIIRSSTDDKRQATESVIYQFDPLKNPLNANDANKNDLKWLEELLQGDLYGSISNISDSWSISNESETDDFLNPPTPPMRIDSLPDEDQPPPLQQQLEPVSPSSKSRTSWFTSPSTSSGHNSNLEKAQNDQKKTSKWWSQILEKAPGLINKSKGNVIDRPLLRVKVSIQKKGMLYKITSGPVEDLFGEYSGRWCVLENTNFYCYSDNSCLNMKEQFQAVNILSIQLVPEFKYKYDGEDLYCFELNACGKSRGRHLFGSKNISERWVWMECLAESLTYKFGKKLTSNYMRMGWSYIKEGVSGKWTGAWVLLRERELHYYIDNHSVKTMDLRKARCIILQQSDDPDLPQTNDNGPNMLIDCPHLTLYLRMWTSRETKVWCQMVKRAAHDNGANLDQQQLTANDVPVLVEKCINFIYIHGSMSEGIYRRPGTGSTVSDILTRFRKDAFAVQLTNDVYSEFEVATALKRFFRDLPEPLLGNSQRLYFHQVSKLTNREEKIRMYKSALEQLSPITLNTIKKLIGHLHFISTQSSKNLMSIENLAAIWGPSLLREEKYSKLPMNNSESDNLDSHVVGQLIALYRYIFPEDPTELEKEQLMLKVLERCVKSPQGAVSKKNAGDLRIWIYLHNKDGKTYNIAIGPSKTAYDVCLELKDNMKLEVHEIILEEVVLNERLCRPIHHTEKVLDVVLKWSYWDEMDRKDNYLVMSPLSKYWEFIQKEPMPVVSELKFADNKSKVLKPHTFEFAQANLSCINPKTGQPLYSWKIEDIVWYFGHESKRNPQSRWTITFLETNHHPKRTKNIPYFGNILAWNDPTTRAKWLAAMLKSRYGNNLTPPPKLIGL